MERLGQALGRAWEVAGVRREACFVHEADDCGVDEGREGIKGREHAVGEGLAADCAYRGAPDGLAVGDHGVPGVGVVHFRLAMVG